MVVHFGDFAADFDSRQLRRGVDEIHIGPKAFELLDLLLRSRPRALSKAHLQDRLWPRTGGTESSLSTLVSELRGALGDRARQPRFIRTVFGFGYSFCGTATEATDIPGATAPRVARLRLFLEDREVALHEGDNLLGRVDEGVGWFESPTVSRRHARIRVSGVKATLEDLGSKNGTFLRGRRIDAPASLSDGDEILLGGVHMTFRILPPVSTQTGMGR